MVLCFVSDALCHVSGCSPMPNVMALHVNRSALTVCGAVRFSATPRVHGVLCCSRCWALTVPAVIIVLVQPATFALDQGREPTQIIINCNY